MSQIRNPFGLFEVDELLSSVIFPKVKQILKTADKSDISIIIGCRENKMICYPIW